MTVLSAFPSTAAYDAFWQTAAAGRLELQRCQACRHFRFVPAPNCPACLTEGGAWEPVCGRGTVYAHTVVHRAPNADFASEAPYTIALIDLEEGVRVMARLEDAPPGGAAAGTPVTFAGIGRGNLGAWLRFRCCPSPTRT